MRPETVPTHRCNMHKSPRAVPAKPLVAIGSGGCNRLRRDLGVRAQLVLMNSLAAD
jgi:hypothetical protein